MVVDVANDVASAALDEEDLPGDGVFRLDPERADDLGRRLSRPVTSVWT